MTASSSPLPQVAPGSARAWLLAARPKTLAAALSPVLVGSALAVGKGHFDVRAGLLALLGAFSLQIASNFANDVFDYEKGADTHERLGPARAVQSGWLSPRQMRTGLVIVIALGLALGGLLAWLKGPAIVAIGVASLIAALAYTGGPYPLGYNGLGDVFAMVFFGLVAVLGSEFVHSSPFSVLSFGFAVAVGGLATNLLVVNNVRDETTDVRAGKRTLVVRYGRSFAEFEFAFFTVVAYAVPLSAATWGHQGPWVLLPLVTLPLGIRNFRALRALHGPALNSLLGGVAGLLLLYSLLTAVGLVVAGRGVL